MTNAEFTGGNRMVQEAKAGGPKGGRKPGQHGRYLLLRSWITANAAWLTLAAISHNLLRAAGSLASLAYGKARDATMRRDLFDVAARTARYGRGHITLHLPVGWPREQEWMDLFGATCGPPAAAA